MQLTIDHVLPRSKGGTDADDNKVVACYSCNTITCQYTPSDARDTEAMIAEKRLLVRSRREEYHKYWLDSVAPRWLALER